jgi:ring-1,2-phenylacetyl-CoA epoxidase subunit PaaD
VVTARAPLIDEAAVRAVLHDVADPEIPAVSIVDLGIVGDVRVEPGAIRVELLPTWVACPAVEMIRAAVLDRLHALAPDTNLSVDLSFAEPWTSDRITPAGREALRRSGFAPPLPASAAGSPIVLGVAVPCPYCGSRRTVLDNPFGPTACRSLRYCTDCRQPFEQFKSI